MSKATLHTICGNSLCRVTPLSAFCRLDEHSGMERRVPASQQALNALRRIYFHDSVAKELCITKKKSKCMLNNSCTVIPPNIRKIINYSHTPHSGPQGPEGLSCLVVTDHGQEARSLRIRIDQPRRRRGLWSNFPLQIGCHASERSWRHQVRTEIYLLAAKGSSMYDKDPRWQGHDRKLHPKGRRSIHTIPPDAGAHEDLRTLLRSLHRHQTKKETPH